jgi:hypothetical protein
MHKFILITLTIILFDQQLISQSLAAEITAKPNIIYCAVASCTFYNVKSNLLLSVDVVDKRWSATQVKTVRVPVIPSNGAYYEFPICTRNNPKGSIFQYWQSFWKVHTIYDELVLLHGVNAKAKLRSNTQRIICETNFNFSQRIHPIMDYFVKGTTIKQLTAEVSS